MADESTNAGLQWRPGVGLLFFWVLFLVGSVPMGLVSLWNAHTTREHVEALQDENLRSLSSSLAEVAFGYLEDRRRMVTLIKLAVEREPEWTGAELQSFLDAEVEASRSLLSLILSGSDGVSVVFSPATRANGSTSQAGSDYSDQDYFREFKETRAIAWSRAQPLAQSKEPGVMVAMAARSPHTGEEGLLVGGIGLVDLAQMVETAAPNDDTRVLIIDHAGGVVVDSSRRLSVGTEAVDTHPFLPTCPPIASMMTDEDGHMLRTACAQVPLGSHLWAVWVVKRQATIQSGLAGIWKQQLWPVFLMISMVGILAMTVGLLVRRYFTRLNRHVGRLGVGSFELELPHSNLFTPRELVVFRRTVRTVLSKIQANGQQNDRLVSELEEANRRLHPLAAAWAQIGEAVEILDGEGRILFANPACVEVLGDEATATGSRSTIWDEAQSARIQESFDRKKRWTGEVTVEGPQGRRVQAVTATPVFDGDQVERVVVIRWDLTDLRTAEMMAAHSDRLANLGTLAAGLAHEINNPLTYVTLNLQMLLDDATERENSELATAAAEALEGVGLIQTVVREILLIARGRNESGQGQVREVVPVQQVIDSAVTLARGRLRGRATVDVSVNAAPNVFVRVAELTQVLVNLVVNAGLAYPSGGPSGVVQILARQEQEDDQQVVVIEVRDSGVGMSVDQLRQAFDPFFTTRRVGEGTGLGLPLARSIVDAHGGTLSAQSAKGVGSVFTVRLHAGAASDGSERTTLRRAPDRPLRVLVVDDDRRVARVIGRALSRHQVTVAIGGMEALLQLEQGSFDVVLSDVMMPDLDGPGLFEEVSAHWPQLAGRFAFITGAPRGSAVARAVTQTGRPVFHKPIQAPLIERWMASLEPV